MKRKAPACCQPNRNEEGLTLLQEAEKEFLRKKLKDCAGNLTHLARHLGLTHPITLRNKLKKYSLWPIKQPEPNETLESTENTAVSGQEEGVATTPETVGTNPV